MKNQIELLATNNFPKLYQARDAKTAVLRAFQEVQRIRREQEREEFRAFRAEMEAEISKRWGSK